MPTLDSIERWLEWPEWAKDGVITHVEIHLDWRDRLLVLIGRPVLVTTKALTENVAGRTEGRSRVSVPRIIWPWSRRPPCSVADQVAPEPRR
jgi:hypothetical protein